MPLCCCSLRFATLNLAHHRPSRLVTSPVSLPLHSTPWRLDRSTTRRCVASARSGDRAETDGERGWYEFFDDVLDDAGAVSQGEGTGSASPLSTTPTAFERARLQMVGGPDPADSERAAFSSGPVSGDTPDSGQEHAQWTPRRSSAWSSGPRHAGTTYVQAHATLTSGFDRWPRSAVRVQEFRARAASMKKDAHVPPKFISLRNSQRPTAFFSMRWHRNLARLSRKYDKLLEQQYGGELEAPVLDPATSSWVESVTDQLDGTTGSLSLETVEDRDLQHSGQLSRWPQIVFWLLAYDRERVVDFLLATHCEPYPPILWVEDCLSLLARQYTHENIADSSFQRLADAFIVLACRQTRQSADHPSPQLERMFMGSSFVRLLLPHCSNEQISKIYKTIKLHNVKVHFNTYHHLSTWFAENGHLEQGIDALLSAQDAGSDVDSIQFRKNCSTLLRRTMQYPGGLRLSLRIVDNLVAMGVKLEGQLCTIIMLNAVEAGDHNTAFLVYRSMTGQGLTPDEYGFSILLRACKANPDDVSTLTEIIQSVVESGLVRDNCILATEILHCLALHHANKDPTRVFSVIKDAYKELFKPQPLQKLGIPLTSPAVAVATPEANLHDPSPHAINFMIAAYLENTTDEVVIQLYARWRELLDAGDEHAALLASTPHTAAVFLGRFTRKRETLLHAAQVIKDMQRPLPSTHKIIQAVPDVIAWSIFLHGFSRHGLTKLAHQVLRYMRKQGIEPTTFTLNNLVAGCAGAQDLSGTLDALRELSSMNKAFDNWTYRGLARYHDQAQLKAEMRRAEYERNLDFISEMKETLLQRVGDARLDDGMHDTGDVQGSPATSVAGHVDSHVREEKDREEDGEVLYSPNKGHLSAVNR